MPASPTVWRWMLTVRYGMPSALGAITSAAPSMRLTASATFCAAALSPFRSEPNSLMATSPRVPVSISEMRISMGCVKP